jgi:prefoldin subunit 5
VKERFLVSIGARILVELEKKDVVNILRKRENTLKSVIKEIEKEIENVVSQQKKLAEGIKKGS